MKKIAQKTIEVIDDIECDICGKTCKDHLDNIESASLSAYWGYYSKKDGQNYEIDICEKCFDKTLEFLAKLKGSVILPITENNL
jgi:hypothetical protein